jgi:3-hydroxyisobutyrate dehydrogenase
MSNSTVAVLGTGTMGAGMVRSLRRADIPVRMWNRDGSKAAALTDTGAEAFDTAAEAVAGADVVLTMLFDADSAIEVVRQADVPAGTVWLQTSTVGVEGIERVAEVARELELVLVDSPVLGTKAPAEQGQLVMLASGPEEQRTALAPVFDALGRKTVWAGEAGTGSRLKMACNAWLISISVGTAQSIALARGLGLDPQLFLDAVDGGPMDTPYAKMKAKNMITGEHPVSFGLTGATKDAVLIQAALQAAGVSDRFDAAAVETMQLAIDRLPDPGAVDLSALIVGLEQRD